MSDKKFRISYSHEGSSTVQRTEVRASSASHARQVIKERYQGKVKIISVVEA